MRKWEAERLGKGGPTAVGGDLNAARPGAT